MYSSWRLAGLIHNALILLVILFRKALLLSNEMQNSLSEISELADEITDLEENYVEYAAIIRTKVAEEDDPYHDEFVNRCGELEIKIQKKG